MRRAIVLAISLTGLVATASAGERYPHTPAPGSIVPVTWTTLGNNDFAAHPNCSYGAPCCCVDPNNPNDNGFCTGVRACADSYGKCTGDSSKCR